MIIYTRAGQTINSLASDILGCNDESFANEILKYNQNSLAVTLMPANSCLAPNRSLWIPGFSYLDNRPEIRSTMMQRVEYLPSTARNNIAFLQTKGVDLNKAIGVAKATQKHNASNQDQGTAIIASLAASETLKRGSERMLEKPPDSFVANMRTLNNSLSDYITNKTPENLQRFRQAKNLATEAINREANLYTNIINNKTKKLLRSSKRLINSVQNKGIIINNLEDMKTFEKIARYGKISSRGLFFVSAGIGADEIYQAYKEGGDWGKEAVGVGGEVVSVYLLGDVLLLSNPAGWVVTILVAVAEGVLLTGFGQMVKNLSEEAYEWFKDNYVRWS